VMEITLYSMRSCACILFILRPSRPLSQAFLSIWFCSVPVQKQQCSIRYKYRDRAIDRAVMYTRNAQTLQDRPTIIAINDVATLTMNGKNCTRQKRKSKRHKAPDVYGCNNNVTTNIYL